VAARPGAADALGSLTPTLAGLVLWSVYGGRCFVSVVRLDGFPANPMEPRARALMQFEGAEHVCVFVIGLRAHHGSVGAPRCTIGRRLPRARAAPIAQVSHRLRAFPVG